MGGQRGLRYALYLACDDLREAGESLKKQGAVASAFDVTEKLRYGDVLAAGSAVLQRSGAGEAMVRLDGQAREMPRSLPAGFTGGEMAAETALTLSMSPAERAEQAETVSWGEDPVRLLAERLWAAAGNR